MPGARTYQFQLSTSSTFRDNGILYNNASLTTPVAAPTLTLPWITGSPHALYARVRAVTDATTSPWSAAFGFDVTPPAPPTPLPSYPGLLRWTPIAGADAYEVWLVDTGKVEYVRTNVLDEREFYTFHQSQQWIGTVRWRIRALRGDQFNQRVNGLPVAQHGAWSPDLQLDEPGMSRRHDPARRHGVGRLLERQRELACARADARVPLEREPDRERRRPPSCTASRSSPTSSA